MLPRRFQFLAGGLLLLASLVLVSSLRAQDQLLRGFTIKAEAKASGAERNQQVDLWVFEVRFKTLRMITVNLTDSKTGAKSKELVWYLIYRAVNRPLQKQADSDLRPENEFDPDPGRPIFAPEITLVTTDNNRQVRYSDQILPEAQAQISARERLPLKNSVEVVGPIPATTPLDAKKDIGPIYGVAMWKGIDPRTDHLTVYLSGFSNGYRYVTGPVPFSSIRNAFNQGQVERSTAVWNGRMTNDWTSLHTLLKADEPPADQSAWFVAVPQTPDGPASGSHLWTKTLVQQYWRPGDAVDQNEAEFLRRSPKGEVYEPKWIYRRAMTGTAAAAAPAAGTTKR